MYRNSDLVSFVSAFPVVEFDMSNLFSIIPDSQVSGAFAGFTRSFVEVVNLIEILPLDTALNWVATADAKARAKTMLARLRIPERLMGLAPATFSGGEQQRVNIARSFAADYPILLLDEPTASLDTRNRETVITLIGEAKARGAAIVGIFHDDEVREAVADRLFEVEAHRVAA